MAYIIGIVYEDEEKELRRRGWEPEKCPVELIPEGTSEEEAARYLMFYVDQNVLDVMSGPDWEKG